MQKKGKAMLERRLKPRRMQYSSCYTSAQSCSINRFGIASAWGRTGNDDVNGGLPEILPVLPLPMAAAGEVNKVT